jgi:hypothetical protein
MVLILLSISVAAIAVAISVTRCHTSFESLAGFEVEREDIAMPKKQSEQSRITTPMRQFLIVVLPDGRVVDPLIRWQGTVCSRPVS